MAEPIHNSRIVIIGAGVFGLSTALQLVKQGYQSVTVLDRSLPPVADGSSVDISRIIRFDYSDAVYAKLAHEAFLEWETNKAYSRAFHPTPFLLVTQETEHVNVPDKTYLGTIRGHLQTLGMKWTDLQSSAEARKAFPALTGKLASPGFSGYVNYRAGWADAQYAVTLARDQCVQAGVSFVSGREGTVTGFHYRSDGSVESVETLAGRRIEADRFILAAGAWSASLVPLGKATISTGQIVAYVRLSEQEATRRATLPIYINMSTGFFGFPTHPDTDYLKIACHGFGYTNTCKLPAQDRSVSAPPPKRIPERSTYIPEEGLARLREGLVELLGEAYAGARFEKTAVCWYTETPTGDYIIDSHPEHRNLLIATGGSGHGFKMLPILGKYVVQALEGRLSTELRERWRISEALLRGERDFVGDGSRGGPARREFSESEKARL